MEQLHANLNLAKANFDAAYIAKTPVPYMRSMNSVGYEIPQNARPVFEILIRHLEHRRGRQINVLDVGASYGINAALLRYNIALESLYEHYLRNAHLADNPERMQVLDRQYFAQLGHRLTARFIGLDSSSNAISYASAIGLLARGLALNLEDEKTDSVGEILDVDIIISTGTVGYVGPRTLTKVLNHCRHAKDVWVATFALRLVDFDPFEVALREWGMRTETIPDLFIQRQVLDDDERVRTRRYADERGLAPRDYVRGNELLSQFFLSRSSEEATIPLPRILQSAKYPSRLSA